VTTPASAAPAPDDRGARDWWLRALLVLQRPRPVFVALRDESKESLSDRTEPILLIVLLAGIAVVLATRTAGRLLDYGNLDDKTLIPFWAFIVGSLNGVVGYFVVGGALHAGVHAMGSQGTFRRSRQLLAFAATPLALSLVLWPVKLALFGGDVFRSGGSDSGSAGAVFAWLWLGFVAWSLVLLVTGVRSVHGWTWGRSAAACVLAVVLVAAAAAGLSGV